MSDRFFEKFYILVVFEENIFFQAEDGIRDRSPSRGLGDVYKRQAPVAPRGLKFWTNVGHLALT